MTAANLHDTVRSYIESLSEHRPSDVEEAVALTALGKLAAEEEALRNLTPSPDGGYGPNNAAAWKVEYLYRLRERNLFRDALRQISEFDVGVRLAPVAACIEIARAALGEEPKA